MSAKNISFNLTSVKMYALQWPVLSKQSATTESLTKIHTNCFRRRTVIWIERSVHWKLHLLILFRVRRTLLLLSNKIAFGKRRGKDFMMQKKIKPEKLQTYSSSTMLKSTKWKQITRKSCKMLRLNLKKMPNHLSRELTRCYQTT